ncbi:MAG: heavy-metal-associated domain-containing protein [candidate division KSB1 bacterium]|nr:heavy-metal-associated domain-containing protein [candidate division KSB1 bacterium]MDZ7364921.1 heavy-metal-associated domain-containing protein [candidate division KSB1 bacterium]MDZ7403022.1 heavy-metal-associated domain-containing protein [candidate division KSB1 bacterium]
MQKIMVLILTLSVLLVACQKSEQTATASQADIKVPTIQCEICAKNVKTALEALQGVKTASVDLTTKVAQVSFDPGNLTLADLENAIAKAGYDANDTKRDPLAYEDLDACCKLPEDR